MTGIAMRRGVSSLHMQEVTAANQRAVDAYDRAVNQYVSMRGDPVAELEASIKSDDGCLMSHAVLGMLFGLSTGHTVDFPVIANALKNTENLIKKGVGTRRERLYAAAFHAWTAGHLRLAVNLLETILVHHPTDIVTLRTCHDCLFFMGEKEEMRNSVARVFRMWDVTMPEFAKVCGMLAFG